MSKGAPRNSFEYMSFNERNCCHCAKYDPDAYPTCPLDEAFHNAQLGDPLPQWVIDKLA